MVGADDAAGRQPEHQPVALPVIDYRWRLPSPVLGGRLQLQANSLALSRSVGQDTQRAFAAAEWKLRTLTGLGQALTFTAYARGDVYHSSHNSQNPIAAYAGANGWKTRGIAAAAVDMEWPFVVRSSAAPSASRRMFSSSPRRASRTSPCPTRIPAPSIWKTATCSRSTASRL
jgi:LPS-assembly protein